MATSVEIRVAVFDQSDGLARAVDSQPEERIQIVDGLEVRGHQHVAIAARAGGAAGTAGKNIVRANYGTRICCGLKS